MMLTGWNAPAFPASHWIPPILGTAVFLYGGPPFLRGGWGELRSRRPGMMLLISMGLSVAFGASVATTLGIIDTDLWPELATLVTIMLLGHWLEMRALGQARGALAALAALLPDEAERVGAGGIEKVALHDLRPRDVVLVRSGGRVPADGQVVEGEAEVDESMVTGESRPVSKRAGDRVVAGTVATDSAIRVLVDAVGDDTALAGIQRLVAEAQESRSRAQALADRAAALLFYVAVVAGAATFAAWALAGDSDDAFVRTVTVLVIACPHALGLAIPLVISLSTSISARAGILIKDRLAPRAHAHGRRRAVRQDRHLDQGEPRGERDSRSRHPRGRPPGRCWRGGGRFRASAGQGHRGRRGRTGRGPQSRRLPLHHRTGGGGRGRRRQGGGGRTGPSA